MLFDAAADVSLDEAIAVYEDAIPKLMAG